MEVQTETDYLHHFVPQISLFFHFRPIQLCSNYLLDRLLRGKKSIDRIEDDRVDLKTVFPRWTNSSLGTWPVEVIKRYDESCLHTRRAIDPRSILDRSSIEVVKGVVRFFEEYVTSDDSNRFSIILHPLLSRYTRYLSKRDLSQDTVVHIREQSSRGSRPGTDPFRVMDKVDIGRRRFLSIFHHG